MQSGDELPVGVYESMDGDVRGGAPLAPCARAPGAGIAPLIEVSDEDYRSFYLPCHAFEEDPGAATGD